MSSKLYYFSSIILNIFWHSIIFHVSCHIISWKCMLKMFMTWLACELLKYQESFRWEVFQLDWVNSQQLHQEEAEHPYCDRTPPKTWEWLYWKWLDCWAFFWQLFLWPELLCFVNLSITSPLHRHNLLFFQLIIIFFLKLKHTKGYFPSVRYKLVFNHIVHRILFIS